MGFGLPAALGAELARPGATVVNIDGDGSFQMTPHELATAVAARIAVITVILNNGRLGMVDQWQRMFYDERRSQSDLRAGMPAFAAIAAGYGALGFDVRDEAALMAALDAALAAHEVPTVIDVRIDEAEACFPYPYEVVEPARRGGEDLPCGQVIRYAVRRTFAGCIRQATRWRLSGTSARRSPWRRRASRVSASPTARI
jgi:hypothetical protein